MRMTQTRLGFFLAALLIGLLIENIAMAQTSRVLPTKDRISVDTQSGFDLGGQISIYHYQEHVVADSEFVQLDGPKIGIIVKGTQTFGSLLFLSGEARFAFGEDAYRSATGHEHGKDDYLGELRVLAGHDISFNNSSPLNRFVIAPYTGFGFRDLYNDGRGHDFFNYFGYRRNSQYFYLPIGVTPHIRTGYDWRISPNLEYDQLLFGNQASYLSDINKHDDIYNSFSDHPHAYFTDLYTHQHGGYGLRGNVMFETTNYSLGPFFNYWNIDASDIGTYHCNLSTCHGFEPHNQTWEAGLQANYHFN